MAMHPIRHYKQLSQEDLEDLLYYAEAQSKEIRKQVEEEYLNNEECINSSITFMEYIAEMYDNVKILIDYYTTGSHPK